MIKYNKINKIGTIFVDISQTTAILFVCLPDTFRGIHEGYFDERIFVLSQNSAILYDTKCELGIILQILTKIKNLKFRKICPQFLFKIINIY